MDVKVLLVDDEEEVLKSFVALFRRRYRVHTALDGEEGLAILEREGPFAVVIADMRMPCMDGVEVLRRVAAQAPDTVRMMLTGDADQSTAARAVNEGRIFRFLNKPCPMDQMAHALSAAVRHYELVTSERVLLEQTLQGSVHVLVEALALCNPAAFQRTGRIRRIVGQLLDRSAAENRWLVEVAGALSQAGCLTVPEVLLNRSLHGLALTPSERRIVENHPRAGSRLIAHIPRLEAAASMIAEQRTPYAVLASRSFEPPVLSGASMLHIAIDLDAFLCRGETQAVIVRRMLGDTAEYHPELVGMLAGCALDLDEPAGAPRRIHVQNLRNGMVLADQVRSTSGVLVVPELFPVNDTVRERLLNFADQQLIPDMIRVFPAADLPGGGLKTPLPHPEGVPHRRRR